MYTLVTLLGDFYQRTFERLYQTARARPFRSFAAFALFVLSVFAIEKLVNLYFPGYSIVLFISAAIAPCLFGFAIRFLRYEFI